MMNIIFDDGLHELAPMTDLRGAFDIRTGILTSLERIARSLEHPLTDVLVPEHLASVTREAHARLNINPSFEAVGSAGDVTLVNGCWVNPPRQLALEEDTAWISDDRQYVLAARMTGPFAIDFVDGGGIPAGIDLVEIAGAQVLQHPWDVIRYRDAVLRDDVERTKVDEAPRLPDGCTIIAGDHRIVIHRTARVGPGSVLDAEAGPIVIDRDAIVRPGAILCGPCSVGRGATIVERAHIKANTVIGPRCKVGGEVGGTIFQGFSNKAHEGHLGDSWVGEWVNFGAATTNSNLLNTYCEVTMRATPQGSRKRTGLTFLGCIVGDHVKFAINSRIMTGTVIGTGAMIATSTPPPTTVPPFAWLTDDAAQAGDRNYRLEKFLDVAATVMGRRDVILTDAMKSAIAKLHSA
ncbi:MAG: putative sugar nucleotidyl transferase [Phycisphaerales bacterium]